jgi:hypothetical protein
MEDWQEMLIIILAILIGISAYFIYLGYQFAGLQQAISGYSGSYGRIRGGQSFSGDSSPTNNIFNGIPGLDSTGS